MTDLRLPSQPQGITAHWLVPNYTAWWQRHMCVNNLPRVALDSGGWDSNPRPVDRKSSILTTWPPSHTFILLHRLDLCCLHFYGKINFFSFFLYSWMTRCRLFQFSKYGKPTISSSFGFCLTNWFFHRSFQVSLRSNGFPEKNRQVLLLLVSQVGRPSCHQPTTYKYQRNQTHSLTTIITIIFFCSLIVRNAEASMVEIESCDRPYKRTSASATHPRVQYECKQCILAYYCIADIVKQ